MSGVWRHGPFQLWGRGNIFDHNFLNIYPISTFVVSVDAYGNGKNDPIKIYDFMRHVTSPDHVMCQKWLPTKNEND